MLKVKFENHSSGGVVMFGSPYIDIPGHAIGDKAVIVKMPETPKSEALINHIKRRYPAMVVTIVDEDGGETPLSGAAIEEPVAGEAAKAVAASVMTEAEFRENVVSVEKRAPDGAFLPSTALRSLSRYRLRAMMTPLLPHMPPTLPKQGSSDL